MLQITFTRRGVSRLPAPAPLSYRVEGSGQIPEKQSGFDEYRVEFIFMLMFLLTTNIKSSFLLIGVM